MRASFPQTGFIPQNPAPGFGGPASLRGGPSRWLRPLYAKPGVGLDGMAALGAARHRNLGHLGEAQPVLLPMGRSIRRAGRVDLKPYSPGSCLHPSPEGLRIQPKHSSPVLGWETQNKMKRGTISFFFFFFLQALSPLSLSPEPGSSLDYHWHRFLCFHISAPGKGGGKGWDRGKGSLCFTKKSM